MSKDEFTQKQGGKELKKVVKRLRAEFGQPDRSDLPESMGRRDRRKLAREIERLVQHESEVNAARRQAEKRAEAAERGISEVAREVRNRAEQELRAERERLHAVFTQSLASTRRELNEQFQRELTAARDAFERQLQIQRDSYEELGRRLRLAEERLAELGTSQSQGQPAVTSAGIEPAPRRFVPTPFRPPHRAP